MLTSRYMSSTKNIPAIMQKIVAGTAPEKFTIEHLQGLGFKSSHDRGIIPLLKDLGFLSADGVPTQRYHQYRDTSQSKAVMAEAIHEAYQELFHINAKPTNTDRQAIQGKFKSTHNLSDRVAEMMTATFYAFLKLADLDAPTPKTRLPKTGDSTEKREKAEMQLPHIAPDEPKLINLRYNIEIHLPATKDIEVYNAIFKSLKEHVID